MLDINVLGDEILTVKCKEVTKFDDALKVLTDAMFETMYEANGIGLAGPQVGVDKKLFVIDVTGHGPMVFINPEIIETSHEQCYMEEGCLSVPGVFHDVLRPSKIKVQAQDLKGKSFVMEADGLLGRCIQHEYDHLLGKLFIDRLDEKERERMVHLFNKRNRKRKSR